MLTRMAEPLDVDSLERRISAYDCEDWSADEGRAIIAELRRLRALEAQFAAQVVVGECPLPDPSLSLTEPK